MNRTLLWFLCCCALVGAACDPAGTGADGEDGDGRRAASAVPIQRVVLYRSGIAYVERFGEITGDTLVLEIQPEQINDILTTLTIIVDGGRNVASSIGLPIERTIAQDLDQLPPQVRQQGGMLSLLNAFRGAEVELEAVTGSVEGRIVGTEALVNDDGNQIRRVTVMSNEGELRQFRIDEIRRVNLKNNTLEVGLGHSLDVSLGEGDWKPVELTFHLSGEAGEDDEEPVHEVFISYVVEMPTWKPTYRVIVDDGELYLQGWAAVDNVSGEDWDDVELSLVAGTPISFQYDLHSPRFISRPDLTSRGFDGEMAVLAPPVDDGVYARPQSASSSPSRTGRARDRRRNSEREARVEEEEAGDWDTGGSAGYWADPAPEPEPDMVMEVTTAGDAFNVETQMLVDGMTESAATEQFDNLFRYDVGYDISVRDRGSALVTIVNEPLEGEDVLYFDPNSGQVRNNPYRAIRMENETGFTIERGPLSIFKESTFVGQAIGPRISEGEMVFLPYSVDGRFRISERRSRGEEGVRLVRIVNSVIYSEVQRVNRHTYQIVNNSGESARLYIRVQKQTNWDLRTPSEGALDQGLVWYVPVDLDGTESQEFTVETASTVTREVEIWSEIAAETINLYISNPDAVPQLRDQLQTVLEQRARIAQIERDLNTQRRLRTDVYRRMAEIRANLEALGDTRQSRDLRRTLERRLGEQGDEATTLTVAIVELEEEEAELRARISTALMDLELAELPEDEGSDDEGEQ